jgi:DNA-binding IclR family transcriptional regulator
MLSSLAAERIVEQDPVSKLYRLGLAVLDLAASRMQSFHFLSNAVDEIHALRDRIGESVGIHVLDSHEMICLEFAEASHPVRVGFWVGERAPVHLTATGLASLSTMERDQWAPILANSIAAYPALPTLTEAKARTVLIQAKKSGFAIANETYVRGVRAVAVPVCDGRGVVTLTLSIAVPAQRRSEADLRAWVPALTEVAESIKRNMLGRRDTSLIQRIGLSSIKGKI